MWYFTWILGVLLACSFGIINAMWLEFNGYPGEDERAIRVNKDLMPVLSLRQIVQSEKSRLHLAIALGATAVITDDLAVLAAGDFM